MQEDVKAYEPDYSLKEAVGKDVDLTKLFTPERLRKCQEIIEAARDEFFIEESEKVKMMQVFILQKDLTTFNAIADMAQEIKSQARIFGFTFIANLCSQIVHFCLSDEKPLPVRLQILERFITALDLAMSSRVRDEGGNLEGQLKQISR